MKSAFVVLMLLATPAFAQESGAPPVVVTPLLETSTTISEQPIRLPQNDAHLAVATYEIAVGATLPEHKHPFPRYAYVLQGKIEVTNTETGKSAVYETGAVIVEAVDQWHRAANVGTDPVKLVVFDMTEHAAANVVKK